MNKKYKIKQTKKKNIKHEEKVIWSDEVKMNFLAYLQNTHITMKTHTVVKTSHFADAFLQSDGETGKIWWEQMELKTGKEKLQQSELQWNCSDQSMSIF